MELFLELFDQFRYMGGMLAVLLILTLPALHRRENFKKRFGIACVVWLAASLAFVPLKAAAAGAFERMPILTAPYWLAMSFLPVWLVCSCFRTNLAGALFRVILAAVMENVATILIRDSLVGSLYPDLPQRRFLLYLAVMVGVYAAVCGLTWIHLAPKLSRDESDMYENEKKAGAAYLAVYLTQSLIISSDRALCEHVILPLRAESAAHQTIYWEVHAGLIVSMLLVNIAISSILILLYRTITIQNERQVILQLMKERQAQYEFSRENIEMINRKAHDLKHQLRALEQVSDEERKALIRETRKSIDFYDAVVKTGNEALDTILTEKSVFCRNRSIRLSCTVNSGGLERISLVDLYTLLGNAIDNAIESVDRLADQEKKVISLSITDKGGMVYLRLENYYEGEIALEQGIPVTGKGDSFNHGFGVKSIRDIARRYGGEMSIRTEGQIFSLEVLIPEN